MEGLSGSGNVMASADAGSSCGTQGASHISTGIAIRLRSRPVAMACQRPRLGGWAAAVVVAAGTAPLNCTRKTRIGSDMFLTVCAPKSSKERSSLPLT